MISDHNSVQQRYLGVAERLTIALL